jgi:hypothetical protein
MQSLCAALYKLSVHDVEACRNERHGGSKDSLKKELNKHQNIPRRGRDMRQSRVQTSVTPLQRRYDLVLKIRYTARAFGFYSPHLNSRSKLFVFREYKRNI